ncbi:hypothetical protein [Okeania sp. SIO2B3]|uniref:hypothetical protein n=1 Tax=Okeania sp. SIO2B3 TaxID=2607784 RepID=UPI0013C26850|nr:hypothetical protein [Okeania sp. SIO2B3]NET40769.1 hypothetical protein [Okeania sp. SIO2B3]
MGLIPHGLHDANAVGGVRIPIDPILLYTVLIVFCTWGLTPVSRENIDQYSGL